MNFEDLIEQLEARFGNPYAPQHYRIIQEAIEVLKLQADEIHALHEEFKHD